MNLSGSISDRSHVFFRAIYLNATIQTFICQFHSNLNTKFGIGSVDMSKNSLIKYGWLRAIIGLPIFFVIVRATGSLPQYIMRFLNIQNGRLVYVTNSLVFLLLGIYLVRTFIDRKSFTSLGFSINGITKDALSGLAGAFIIMSLGFGILYILGCVDIVSVDFSITTLLFWAVYLLLAAALEELPMRGYMLNNMMCSMNSYLAIGIIGLIFGFIHATGQNVSAIGILNCTLLGVMAGLFYIRSENLWMPIMFHAGWNFFQGTVFGFRVSGIAFDYALLSTTLSGNEFLTGGSYGFEGSLILTCLTIPAIILYEMNYRKRVIIATST